MTDKVDGIQVEAIASGAVHIVSTTSTIDFTTSPLLGGDFNNDGVINEVDYSLFFYQQSLLTCFILVVLTVR